MNLLKLVNVIMAVRQFCTWPTLMNVMYVVVVLSVHVNVRKLPDLLSTCCSWYRHTVDFTCSNFHNLHITWRVLGFELSKLKEPRSSDGSGKVIPNLVLNVWVLWEQLIVPQFCHHSYRHHICLPSSLTWQSDRLPKRWSINKLIVSHVTFL